MRKAVLLSALFSALSFSLSAHAELITKGLVDGTAIAIPGDNEFGAGPYVISDGITWTNSDDNGVFGFTGPWNFGGNNWTDGVPMVGNNTGDDGLMTFTFDTPVFSVAALLNYYPDEGGFLTISSYDSSHTLLETYTTNFSVSMDNSGENLGFLDSTADISYFTVSGPYAGARNLVINGVPPAPTPEPSSFALLGTGFVGLAGAFRKKLRKA